MNQEQIQLQRNNLIRDLLKVIENHRTEVGCCMISSDIIGAIEWVKMEYYLSAKDNAILDYTDYREE